MRHAAAALAAVALLAALAVATTIAATPAVAASRPLQLGFFDPVYTAAPAISNPWLQRTVEAGADIVKIDAGWPAASRPRNPRDPADPTYDFSRTDAAVKNAAAHGLQILLEFTGAPAWAEGPNRPSSAAAGTWRPDPTAIGDYGAALARRYSGTYPDPAALGRTLPKVKAFQVWNEPNLSIDLTPQWSGRTAVSPTTYRAMLNAFYAGVKSVTPKALVVTAGTAPFGDPGRGGQRMMPALFWRGLLCETQVGHKLQATAICPHPAHFDVLAHDPYPGGSPRWKENYPDDVSIEGMGRLTRILAAAQRSGHALPRGTRKRVWVTEVSYDSKPPDPNGVPLALHARWLQETLYLLWRSGVSLITWFRIVDEPPIPSYGETNQSGLYLLNGTAKPAARAFRFPFVVEPVPGSGSGSGGGGGGRGGHALEAWGRSPVAGRVTVERRHGGRWIAVRRVTVRRRQTFLLRIPASSAPGSLRARVGSERSLVFTAG